MSRQEVRRALDTALMREQRKISRLAIELRTNRITINQWQLAMRTATKNVHLYSAAAARGGFAQMRKSDFGRVGAALRKQYTYIDRLAGEIGGGLPLDGRFLSRVQLYAQSGRSSYVDHDMRLHRDLGYGEERSHLGVADHCDECVAADAMGWQPIGSITPIGSRQCLSRCKCSMSYRRDPGAP